MPRLTSILLFILVLALLAVNLYASSEEGAPLEGVVADQDTTATDPNTDLQTNDIPTDQPSDVTTSTDPATGSAETEKKDKKDKREKKAKKDKKKSKKDKKDKKDKKKSKKEKRKN